MAFKKIIKGSALPKGTESADSVNATIESTVEASLTSLVGSAPAVLDTLEELSTALGNDENFATTVATSLSNKSDTGHGHVVSDVTGLESSLTGLQSSLNNKATLDSGVPIGGFVGQVLTKSRSDQYAMQWDDNKLTSLKDVSVGSPTIGNVLTYKQTTRKNVVTNPSFEDGAAPVTYSTFTPMQNSTSDAYSGTRSAFAPGGAFSYGLSLQLDENSLYEGKSYTLSFYVKRLDSNSGSIGLRTFNTARSVDGNQNSVGTWERFSYSWIEGGNDRPIAITGSNLKNSLGFYLDAILIEDYKPAVEPLYFDGNSAGASWTGTQNASTSTLIGQDQWTSSTFPSEGTVATASAGFGYMGIPQSSGAGTTGSYTITAADAGEHIYATATRTVTIPANSSVALPIGTTIVFIAGTGATMSIAITSDTLKLAGPGTTGTRTLAADGMATAVKVEATVWYISGNGLT